MTVATFTGFSVNVIVTFVSPYLQNEGYGNLQGKIGFIWGSFSLVSALWAFLFLPELKGRSLEELDELFEKRVSVLKFGKYRTTGYGARITKIEEMGRDGEVIAGVEVSPSPHFLGTKKMPEEKAVAMQALDA